MRYPGLYEHGVLVPWKHEHGVLVPWKRRSCSPQKDRAVVDTLRRRDTVTTQASATLTHTAKQLVEQLIDTRARELELLSDLTDEQMLGSKMRIVEPPVWEMGHVGWFQEHWIVRNLDKADPISCD